MVIATCTSPLADPSEFLFAVCLTKTILILNHKLNTKKRTKRKGRHIRKRHNTYPRHQQQKSNDHVKQSNRSLIHRLLDRIISHLGNRMKQRQNPKNEWE